MARPGIIYANVVKTAFELSEIGKNVTVDSVREALGNTGSKSTIAPLVKRWKAEQEANGVAIASGLPAHLLEAVSALNERIQADADLRLQQLTEAHEIAASEAADRLTEANLRIEVLTTECATLYVQFENLRANNDHLSNLNRELKLGTVKANADIVGLNNRLADRAAEIGALQEQLALTRKQFEHYQQSVATQRADERQQTAQQVARLEQNLTELRRNYSDAQTHAAQMEARLAESTQSSQSQRVEVTALRKTHLEVLSEQAGLKHEVSLLVDQKTRLEAQLENAIATRTASQIEIAVSKQARAELNERHALLEKCLADADKESRRLEKANAMILAQLEASHQAQLPGSR